MISVLILTRNEAVNLPECLASIQWCDDIIVFDSYSDDATCDIARSAGARVVQRKFDDYSRQREAARQVNYRHRWVLALDADERPDDILRQEMMTIASSAQPGHDIYRVRRKDHFMGQWIKHVTLYPSWFLRFYRPDRIHYPPRLVHEYPTFDGEAGELAGHLMHYSFNKGLTEWFEKHVQYAEMEARENLDSIRTGSSLDAACRALTFDPVQRRKALKQLSHHMPLRPTLRLAYMLILRRGLLDGRAGLQYAMMMAAYERMIVSNMAWLRSQADLSDQTSDLANNH